MKFSKMAAARAQEGEGDKPVAEPLSSFRPSVHRAGDDACNRSYQIVACRLHQLACSPHCGSMEPSGLSSSEWLS